MALVEFSMFPVDKGESLSRYVARSLEIVDRSGLNYQCHAMGTILEGELDRALKVIQQCFQTMAADCHRIECSIKIDYRQGRQDELRAKIASVEQKLGHEVRK